MKKTLFIVAFLAAALPATAGVVVEAVIARVGDRIITRSQYLNRLNGGLAEIERTAMPSEIERLQTTFRNELLNEMLSELLLKDRADRLGITVTPAEVNEAITRLRTQYGITSEEEFNASLESSGLSRAEMEVRLRDSLLTNKVFSRELRSRADLSDRELRARYEREKEEHRRPERARLREIIMIPTDWAQPGDITDARQRAEEVAQSVRAGADFATVARERSDSPTREQGGDLGVVGKGDLIGALDQAIFAAPGGAIIGPIETRSGFHIVKVEERLPSEIPSFDEVKELLRREASEETFQRDYKAYVEKLRTDAFLQIFEENIPRS